MTSTPDPSPERLMTLAWGYAPTLVVATAIRHRIFEHLAPQPRSASDLTQLTGASARGLRAILNALVALQLLQRTSQETYALTPESSAFLVPGQPGYRGGFFHHHTDHLLPQWMELDRVVRTGKPVAATNRESGGPEHFARFVESLFPGSYPAAQTLADHLQLAATDHPVSVLDLGAGSGVWGIALAKASPHVRVRAVDWPRVLEVTLQSAARHGVADRFTAAPGDYFSADFGNAHQVAVLGHILHSEGPDRIIRLLRKTCAALAPGGVIAIQEFLPDDDRTGPALPLLFAVNMLVNTEHGDTYTFAEISQWLCESGFVNPRLLPVPAVSPLVLADRP